TLTSEVGKPITQSRNEIDGTLGRIDFFLEQVPRVLEDSVVLKEPRLEEKITHEPLGLILNISAWNYPYYVGSNVFLPALLTGNAVLYKPSEVATLTGLAIGNLFQETGLPDGAFSVFPGSGAIGAELLRQRVDGVFFTGSYATGKKIALAAAGRLVRMQLELGGKDPVYVCDDVDVQAAAEATADGAFYNAGQSCCAVERIYVHRKIVDPFVAAFLKTVRGFTVGDPADPSTYLGPLARADQVAVLEDQVADAVRKGARLAAGGKRMDRPGNFFEPTVLLDVTHDMKVMREESFGPIIGIMAVDEDGQALRLMGDTEYGLTAGVYSKDRARAERLLARISAGTAYWNCCDRVSPRLPWSGRGHSGLGTTLSIAGIHSFLQPKAWHLRG
ncbi:MAG TPA: aldehyde dehydrogenase family protein, partial [Planctomycetota bacterium]|nr:aldehyde dehydrogenase family protein [Planctomycetota bacterium]